MFSWHWLLAIYNRPFAVCYSALKTTSATCKCPFMKQTRSKTESVACQLRCAWKIRWIYPGAAVILAAAQISTCWGLLCIKHIRWLYTLLVTSLLNLTLIWCFSIKLSVHKIYFVFFVITYSLKNGLILNILDFQLFEKQQRSTNFGRLVNQCCLAPGNILCFNKNMNIVHDVK